MTCFYSKQWYIKILIKHSHTVFRESPSLCWSVLLPGTQWYRRHRWDWAVCVCWWTTSPTGCHSWPNALPCHFDWTRCRGAGPHADLSDVHSNTWIRGVSESENNSCLLVTAQQTKWKLDRSLSFRIFLFQEGKKRREGENSINEKQVCQSVVPTLYLHKSIRSGRECASTHAKETHDFSNQFFSWFLVYNNNLNLTLWQNHRLCGLDGFLNLTKQTWYMSCDLSVKVFSFWTS